MSSNYIKVLIFDQDDFSKTLIENYFKEFNFPYQIIKYTDFNDEYIQDDNYYKFIFVDINDKNVSILNKIGILSSNAKNIFFLTSGKVSTDLYVKSLRSGAKEFLRKPLVKADVVDAVKNAFKDEMVQEVNDERKPKIISVTSFEKGCGKTFFSINVAREIAGITKEKVLIVDFNDSLNNVAFALDIDPFIDTKDIIQNIKESNAEAYFSRVFNYKKSSLYILSNGLYKSSVEDLNLNNVVKFFEIAKKYYKYIIVDINSNMDVVNSVIFDKSDIIFYMISTSITASEKNRKYISNNIYNKKFKVLLNKYKTKDESKLEEIEANINREIYYKIPMNLTVTAGSANRGKTIREINPDTDIVKAYNRIAKFIIVHRA